MFIIPILLIFHDENQTFTAHASLRVGCLAKSNLDTEEFYLFLRSENTWSNLPGHSDDDHPVYYDSIMSMLMSLGSGEVNEIDLPGVVGAYVLNSRPDYRITCVVRMNKENLAFRDLRGNRDNQSGSNRRSSSD